MPHFSLSLSLTLALALSRLLDLSCVSTTLLFSIGRGTILIRSLLRLSLPSRNLVPEGVACRPEPSAGRSPGWFPFLRYITRILEPLKEIEKNGCSFFDPPPLHSHTHRLFRFVLTPTLPACHQAQMVSDSLQCLYTP
jgi:hypothetical protein